MSTASIYDAVSGEYARLLPDFSYEASKDLAVLNSFIGSIRESNFPVLDAGCGAGRLTPLLREAGLKSVGCDLSEGMIKEARNLYLETVFDLADLQDLPYKSQTFSALISWYSVIHLPKTKVQQTLSEFGRVLVPGGQILLAFQAGEGEQTIENAYGSSLPMKAYLYEPASIASYLDKLGFTSVTIDRRDARPGEPYAQGFVRATSS